MVVACLALGIALAGSSVAAVRAVLPRNSVGTVQLKANAVTSSKVLNGSLLRADFRTGQIPAGPRGLAGPAGPAGPAGAAGPAGPTGPAGPGAKWALIRGTGDIIAQSGGITVTHPFPGGYYVKFADPVTGKAVSATNAYRDTDGAARGALIVTICGEGTEGSSCDFSDNPQTVYVGTFSTAGAAQDHAFYVAVF
jgi:hypothetical protein